LDTIQAKDSSVKVNRGLAWLIIITTVIGIAAIGLYVGNKFFWDKYKNMTKEEFAYRIALKQVKANPSDVAARNNLGWALVEIGQFDKALREYNRSLSLDPKDLTAKYNIALVLIRQEHLAEAQAKLEEIVKDNPKYIDARHELAVLYLKLGKYDEAIKEYEFVNVVRPGNADLIYQLGIAYQKKNDLDKAREYYGKALKYAPNFNEAKEALAKLN
jgi:tetratricopeptide (TPR) repeat protein